MNLVCVTGGCDVDEFQSPWFEGELAEELLGPSAVGAGGFDEHHHLPGLDFAVDKLLSHADKQLSPREGSSLQVVLRSENGGPASWVSFKGTSLEEEFA